MHYLMYYTQRRHEQAIVTELEEEQTSAEFRNKIAHEREEDHIRKKQKTTDSLISALVRIIKIGVYI